ncbi:MAG: hypothetical protein AAF222_14375 [Pseudomonadota bacterium]
MTKTLAIALVAIAGFAGAASAGSATLVNSAQDTLNDYGFSVDADTLTNGQVTALHFVDEGSDVSDAQVRAEIRSILN